MCDPGGVFRDLVFDTTRLDVAPVAIVLARSGAETGVSETGTALAKAGGRRSGYFASGVAALDRTVSPAVWPQDDSGICLSGRRRHCMVGRIGRLVPRIWSADFLPAGFGNSSFAQMVVCSFNWLIS